MTADAGDARPARSGQRAADYVTAVPSRRARGDPPGAYRSLAALPAAQVSDTFSWNFISTREDLTRVPAPIRNQTQGNDQGETEHFVRRFARATPFAISRAARRAT